MMGTAGNAYLTRINSNDTGVAEKGDAAIVTLYVRLAANGNGSTHPIPHTKIRFHDEFYFTTQPLPATGSTTGAPGLIRTPSISDETATITNESAQASSPCMYLERTKRITTETPHDHPHYSCRFSLGFVTNPTQSWICDREPLAYPNKNRPVPLGEMIGLRVRGIDPQQTNPLLPSYSHPHRRWLTLRSADASSVVVSWYGGDEKLMLHDATLSSLTKA
jgi:hypothetical protein